MCGRTCLADRNDGPHAGHGRRGRGARGAGGERADVVAKRLDFIRRKIVSLMRFLATGDVRDQGTWIRRQDRDCSLTLQQLLAMSCPIPVPNPTLPSRT